MKEFKDHWALFILSGQFLNYFLPHHQLGSPPFWNHIIHIWCQGPSMPIEAAKDTGVPYVEMILKKNRLSLDVISCLLTRCTWLNIHIVPPHGIVLEIRIAEGFGARWSEDGIKFMGFLEPYVVDGFLKGWKH
ncbi:uncharacterized protein LOC142542258 isoform X3 [Primulina tabacum]|uniref:uncharacterized protein LOC142542258 isoform X3 n=1 Tax=Primulina tabacum TaxID=48773 RepID=UPI003F597930